MNEWYKCTSQIKYMWEIVFTIVAFFVNFLRKKTVFKLILKSIVFWDSFKKKTVELSILKSVTKSLLLKNIL